MAEYNDSAMRGSETWLTARQMNRSSPRFLRHKAAVPFCKLLLVYLQNKAVAANTRLPCVKRDG